jgi:hypothetical protein
MQRSLPCSTLDTSAAGVHDYPDIAIAASLKTTTGGASGLNTHPALTSSPVPWQTWLFLNLLSPLLGFKLSGQSNAIGELAYHRRFACSLGWLLSAARCAQKSVPLIERTFQFVHQEMEFFFVFFLGRLGSDLPPIAYGLLVSREHASGSPRGGLYLKL